MNIEIGDRFGLLEVVSTVYEEADPSGRLIPYCMVKCDCSSPVRKVRVWKLTSKKRPTRSCGCLQKDRAAATQLTHGGAYTKLYSIWRNMIGRCHNPQKSGYEHYGARGVMVCTEWHDFDQFRQWANSSGYCDELTIDRICNDDGYSPTNCRWVTNKRNQRNRTNNHLLTILGETKCVADWCEDCRCAVKPQTFRNRLATGFDPQEALTLPLIPRGNRKCPQHSRPKG